MTRFYLLALALAACADPTTPEAVDLDLTTARLVPIDPTHELAPPFARYELQLGGRTIDVQLTRNDDLFAPGYTELRTDGGTALPHPESAWANQQPCYYHGSLVDGGVPVGVIAVRTCEDGQPHQLRGMITLDEVLYDLAPEADAYTLVRTRPPTDGFDALPGLPAADPHERLDGLDPNDQRPPALAPRYVELLVVNDPGRTASLGGSPEANTALRVHLAASYYLGSDFPGAIRLAMLGQQTLTGTSPFNPTPVGGGEISSASLLTQFQAYNDGTGIEADHRVLLSNLNFDGATIGFAPVGGICGGAGSNSIIQAGFSTALDASTIAHELGHNLGMLHDGLNNACPTTGFLMSATSCINCPTTPDRFSTCSLAEAAVVLNGALASCLNDAPGSVLGSPQCGNGFVDVGEQCDCGGEGCADIDPCCNGNTCTFASPNFTCSALEPCCDANTCLPVAASANLVCRDASSPDCDVEEVCDGSSGACPFDEVEDNGLSCGTGGTCFLGTCASVQGQCDALEAVFNLPLNANPGCTALIGAGGCGDLVCFVPGSNFCTTLNVNGTNAVVDDGTPCGAGTQCFEGACVPTSSLPQPSNDQCPNDPSKTEPGVCGCGVPDVDSDNDTLLDCVEPSPQLQSVSGVAGGALTFQVDNGTPGARVHLVAGRPGGTVNVPGCAGTTLNLQSVTLLGFVTANAQGRGQLVRNPPSTMSGAQFRFYAVELGSCGVSTPVAHTL